VNNDKRQLADHSGGLLTRVHNRRTVFVYLFLATITFAVFGQTVRYDFVNFDDDLYVYNAPAIKAGLTVKGIVVAVTSPHARNWHPLTTISHMLDCQLYGVNAGGHHATNVLLHVVAVLLLFSVLRQMTDALWKSAIVAALFAIHPLHVESVAWVSERKDVLSAIFFFLMLMTYIRYARAPSITSYLAVVVLFAAGLMSKPMLVTAPFILLLVDYWPLRRFEKPSAVTSAKNPKTGKQKRGTQNLLLEKIPLLVLSAGACAITFMLQKRATGAIPPLPLLWRLQNALVSYVIYIWKTVWPTQLAIFYPHPNDTLTIWQVAGAMTLLVGITLVAIMLRKQRPYLFTGWFWYVVMLVPVIGLVQVGEQGHADRYTYLPHIGLFLVAVWLVADVLPARDTTAPYAVAAVGVIIVALASAAFVQASYWRNSETLWTHAIAVTSENDVAHNNLGYLCVNRSDLESAISHFTTAANIRSHKVNPHYYVASALVQMNLGDGLAQKGQANEAISHYDEAIRLVPNYADAYYNRGNVLFTNGRVDEAIADWERSLQLKPNDADAHTCLGNALLRRGFPNEAIAHYEKALELAPEDARSRNNIAWLLATSSDPAIRNGARAVAFANEAVELSGGREPSFLRTLAAAYAESGGFAEAVAAVRQASVIAAMQGKTKLANRLEKDLVLYRGRLPLRENSPDNKD
jgi:protein O-mannosyl-transferase